MGRVAAVASVALVTLSCMDASAPPKVAEPAGPPVTRASFVVDDEVLSLHLPQNSAPPLASVLVLPSGMGRSESVLKACDRLAQAGFAAIAVDFYGGKVPKTKAESLPLWQDANKRPEELRTLIEHAYEQMATDPRLRSQKRFLLGWSFGGAWATTATRFLSGLSGVVAFYGEAFSENEDLYYTLETPILLIAARDDKDAPSASLRAIAKRLNMNGRKAEFFEVPGKHGFAERNHPGYNAQQAEAGLQRALEFLKKHAQ